MTLKTLLSIFLFIIYCGPLLGQQQKKLNIQALGAEDGLSQSSVLTILEDSYGFMWFGTRDGLNLYDGSKIQVYKNIPNDSTSISGNQINHLTEGTPNTLWIAHSQGISQYDRKASRFKNYKINSDNPEMRSIYVIGGNILACGWDGIFVLDSTLDIFIPYSSTGLSFSVSKIRAAPQKNGYWIASTNNGLCYMDVATLKVEKVFTEKDRHIRVEDIIFHPNGKMYVGTYGHGLLECDSEGQIIRRWSKNLSPGKFKIDNIRSLTIDQNGTIWIGGLQGLATFDPTNGVIEHITPVNSIFDIQDISVRSVMTDRNGSVWIGSYHDGVLLYDKYFARFNIRSLQTSTSEPVEGIISAFAHTTDGRVYLATENGYLMEYLQNNALPSGKILQRPTNNVAPLFKSLYYDEKRKQLWAGTLRDGLFVQSDIGLKKVPLNVSYAEAQSWKDYGVVNDIIPYDDNHLWLLTDKKGGLHLLQQADRQIIDFSARNNLLRWTDKSVGKHIAKIAEDTYLFATRGAGLIYFENRADGQSRQIPIGNSKDINHVTIQGDTIYVSTYGNGLYMLDRSFAVIGQYTTDHGLSNNIVLSAFPDDDSNIWVYTSNGVNLLQKDGGILNYDKKNGFYLAEINAWEHSNTHPHRNIFFAGGKDTWVTFQADRLINNTYIPRVYLTAIRLGSRTITDLSFLNDESHRLRLDASETLLVFEFAGTNYLMPQNNKYRYMMEGYDDQWVYTNSQGTARYNKLPAGRYVFKVQMSNNDGVWSENTVQLSIRKSPPAWLSWPAFLIYILFAAMGIIYLRRNEIRKIKLQQEIIYNEAEQQRTAEAHALKVKHFNDISHEIRTPLTLILHPIEELIESPSLSPKHKKTLQSMQHHGNNLLLLVNQLLEINRLELRRETLYLAPTYLKELVSIIYDSFLPIAQQQEVRWEVDMSSVTESPLMIDRLQMEKILLNMLTNAFKFTPPDGKITLSVETTPTSNRAFDLRIQVTDTGIGIAKEDLPFIFERLYKREHQDNLIGSGIGLALVKAIVVDLMHGSIDVDSVLHEGTTFQIQIANIATTEHQTVERYKKSLLIDNYTVNNISHDPIPNPPQTSDQTSILVVEDNAGLLDLLHKTLGTQHQVIAKTTAEEALEFVKENDVDLIISDVMLPKMSGKTLCSEVKSNIITSHIPFIMLTAIDGESAKIEGLELGADDYITKPFSVKELLLRVNNILIQRSRWRAYLHDRNKAVKSNLRLNKFDDELLRNLDLRLEENLDHTNYGVEDLSADVGLSRVHLFRKLKALTGLSPSQYIRNFRLDKAVEIIEKEDIRIAELAYRVGFQDPNYFLKCFKEKYNSTPTEYLKKYNSPSD